MALFQTEGAAIHLIAWVVPLLGCWFAWPILRRRRSYLVTAAVLCLTPMPVYYSFFTTWYFWWPLILCLPAYLSSWEALQVLFHIGAPYGALMGLLALFLSRFLVRR